MELSGFPFCVTDWSKIERTEHKGATGTSFWRTLGVGDVRVRIMEYAPGYLTGYWCSKGHVFYCLEGELQIELEDGREVSGFVCEVHATIGAEDISSFGGWRAYRRA